MNRSVQDIGGESAGGQPVHCLPATAPREIGPVRCGRASPDLGRRLYEEVASLLRTKHNVPVKTGSFGADDEVELLNDGPVTLIVRSGGRSLGDQPQTLLAE
jgi:D-tyrosyl-tRNA(Tyr) deacylase